MCRGSLLYELWRQHIFEKQTDQSLLQSKPGDVVETRRETFIEAPKDAASRIELRQAGLRLPWRYNLHSRRKLAMEPR
jgi:hypothetical protein